MEFIPEQNCEECGHSLDAVSKIGGAVKKLPLKGDISICGYCGAVGRFDEQLIVRIWTEEDKREIREINQDFYELLLKSQEAVKQMRNDNNQSPNF
jgi:hypothetical protein